MTELTLPADATLLVASDMHLGDHDPGTARFFLNALDANLGSATHLLLLGDLFEAWPGDDQNDPIAQLLVQRLHSLAAQKVQVLVMRGNRDFLLDVAIAAKPDATQANFSALTGATMLEDPTLLHIADYRLLLMHGDSLCTDDLAYQEFRAQNRTKQWQQAFLSEPLEQRMKVARSLREQSKAHQQEQPNEISDVNPDAVDQVLDEAQVSELLHGHTHRPNTHRWTTDQGAKRVRHVLPDWNHVHKSGGFMRIDRTGTSVVALDSA